MRTLKLAIVTILGLGLLIGAFAAGYQARAWQPWLAVSNSDGAAPLADESAPPLQHELYQQVWQLLEQDFYGEDPSVTERVYGSIRGLTDSYGDQYTYFIEPQPRELERDRLRGSFGGIGAWIDRTDDGYILRPMKGQPAAQAGVQAGDRLLAIDDTPITLETDADTVTSLVRGPVGSEICLGVERPDPQRGIPQSLRICIVRAEIQTPSVEWRLLDEDPQTARIGYIKQTIFSERSAEEMKQAIAELDAAGAERFILDLRGNPGGLLDAAVAVADLWLDAGTVLIERRASGEAEVFTSSDGDLSEGAPLVVLVDGGTASASEIVAGALHDRERALLVGEQTFGKGSVQLVHELLDESSLHVTTARWFTPDDNAIDGVGLTPDVAVAPEQDVLARAIELIRQQTASAVVE